MPIPSTGPVSMLDISNEYQGNTGQLALSDYYAGGLYVPAGTTGNEGLIPSSGTINFNHFRGSELIHTLDPVDIIPASNSGFLANAAGVPTAGSLTPQNFRTELCRAVAHSVAGSTIDIALVGQNIPQAFWTSITIGASTFLSASATYNPTGANDSTIWTFGGQASPPWVIDTPIDLFVVYP